MLGATVLGVCFEQTMAWLASSPHCFHHQLRGSPFLGKDADLGTMFQSLDKSPQPLHKSVAMPAPSDASHTACGQHTCCHAWWNPNQAQTQDADLVLLARLPSTQCHREMAAGKGLPRQTLARSQIRSPSRLAHSAPFFWELLARDPAAKSRDMKCRIMSEAFCLGTHTLGTTHSPSGLWRLWRCACSIAPGGMGPSQANGASALGQC